MERTNETASVADSAFAAQVESLAGGKAKGKRQSGKSSTRAVKEDRLARIGVLMAEAGEQIGACQAENEIAKEETRIVVKGMIDEAIKAGLVCDKEAPEGDMLKAPNKSFAGDLYLNFADSLNAIRTANGLDAYAYGTLANMVSRIRKYVREGGEFDLWGNIAAKAAKEAKQNAQGEVQVSAHTRGGESSEDDAEDESRYIGAAALLAYLQKFEDANPIEQASADYKHILGMVGDLRGETEKFIAKQNAAKKGTRTGK